jgi:hypothetical protein
VASGMRGQTSALTELDYLRLHIELVEIAAPIVGLVRSIELVRLVLPY